MHVGKQTLRREKQFLHLWPAGQIRTAPHGGALRIPGEPVKPACSQRPRSLSGS